jgi:hypothetical protein
MDDAEAIYLAEIARDCEGVLGPGCELQGIEPGVTDRDVRLTATFRLGSRTWVSIGSGSTLVDAHADLRARLVIDRLRAGFTEYVDPLPAPHP